jgi:hypothetical protein
MQSFSIHTGQAIPLPPSQTYPTGLTPEFCRLQPKRRLTRRCLLTQWQPCSASTPSVMTAVRSISPHSLFPVCLFNLLWVQATRLTTPRATSFRPMIVPTPGLLCSKPRELPRNWPRLPPRRLRQGEPLTQCQSHRPCLLRLQCQSWLQYRCQSQLRPRAREVRVRIGAGLPVCRSSHIHSVAAPLACLGRGCAIMIGEAELGRDLDPHRAGNRQVAPSGVSSR